MKNPMKKPRPVTVLDRKPTRVDPDGRYRTGKETYEVIRGLVLRVVE